MKTVHWMRVIALLFSFTLAACGGSDISSSSDDGQFNDGGSNDSGNGSGSGSGNGSGDELDPPVATEPGPGGEQVVFSKTDDGTFIVGVDATGAGWVYINLLSQEQVDPADPTVSDEWHLAHRGAEIKLNGGSSGSPSSGVSTAVYADKVELGSRYPLATIVAAPPAANVAYFTDTVGDTDGNPLTPEGDVLAMSTYPDADTTATPIIGLLVGDGDHGWYNVALNTSITHRENVAYVLQTHECRFIKFRMLGYANEVGEDGHPSYEFLEIPGGSCEQNNDSDDGSSGGSDAAPQGLATFTTDSGITTVEVDATSEELWTYLDLTGMQQVVPSSPSSDASGWDIALQRSNFKMNSGVSGVGNVGLHDIFEGDWDVLSSEPDNAEYHVDVEGEDGLGGAFQTYPPGEAASSCGPGAGDYGWYHYTSFCSAPSGGIHKIIPRDVVYVLRGQNGALWKLRVLNYYGSDGEGDSGSLVIQFAPIAQ